MFTEKLQAKRGAKVKRADEGHRKEAKREARTQGQGETAKCQKGISARHPTDCSAAFSAVRM